MTADGQLDIFDFLGDEDSQESQKESKKVTDDVFAVGDMVKVKSIKEITHKLLIEDELTILTYGNKKGKVVGIHKGRVVSYEVELNSGERTYFYGKELILLG